MSKETQEQKQDRTQELVGQTVKSIYKQDNQIRVHFENGLDVMIKPEVTIREFDGMTPVLKMRFID